MAVLQQQRQQQGGGGGSSKLSPSHLGGGGLPKQPMTGDPLSHPGGGGVSLSDFHAKTQAMYSGESPTGGLLLSKGAYNNYICQQDKQYFCRYNEDVHRNKCQQASTNAMLTHSPCSKSS